MGLYAAGDDVPEVGGAAFGLDTEDTGGKLSTKAVFGKTLGLFIAERAAGYHSDPHVHACEQLNYVDEGEIWIFVEDEGYHLEAGDFLRVPALAVHWAWNRGDGSCRLFEAHAPALAEGVPEAVSLLADDEGPPALARNIGADPAYAAAVEAELFGEESP
jgi:mannose-6-phosphate isomerase-like protein (cupin superfamily)